MLLKSAVSSRACAVRSNRAVSACSVASGTAVQPLDRRLVLGGLASVATSILVTEPAEAFIDKQEINRRRKKIPEEEFKDGPEGLKYYDIVPGSGAEATNGARVAIHYDVKFRNITFVTSRIGVGVTGGTPFGYDVGTKTGTPGSAPLKGLDLCTAGMRVGGLRRCIVPPELGYGKKGMREIPPDATLMVDVELLSIKQSAFGSRVKLVEG